MEKAVVHYESLVGTNYDIGYKLGTKTAQIPKLANMQKLERSVFTQQQVTEMKAMFDNYCPGLNEEIAGFCDALKIEPHEFIYSAMTYLTPFCSQIAVLPKISRDGHVRVARNFDFSHKFEEFMFFKTKVVDRFAHMGSSMAQLGRGEGINECGLIVSQTSCGMPVGSNINGLRKPAIVGLQFWAVIRTLLENCKNVKEAIKLLNDMPIAYNLNLILADKTGAAALYETLDGRKSVREIDGNTDKQYLHSTNHAHFPEFKSLEPKAFKHSLVRYEFTQNYMERKETVSEDDLKNLLLSKYPEGLCCHWYNEFFGTIKSMVFDATEGKVDICWGGLLENGWESFDFSGDILTHSQEISINIDEPDMDIFKMI